MKEKERFNRCLKDLDSYCREHSFEIIKTGEGFSSRDSYQEILKIDAQTLQFIREAYNDKSLYLTTQIVLLPSLVQDLSG
ncbi:MAG: hypothetical protein AABW50_02920 [Nanoarchaeota archaeon]